MLSDALDVSILGTNKATAKAQTEEESIFVLIVEKRDTVKETVRKNLNASCAKKDN